MATAPQQKWLIKDPDGRIRGPFSTESVLRKIGRGEVSGEEFIALYPGTHWIPITQDPTFYDQLLEVLSSAESLDSESTHPGSQPEPRTGSAKPNSNNRAIDMDDEPELDLSEPELHRNSTPPSNAASEAETEVEAEPVLPDPKKKRSRSRKQRSGEGDVIELRRMDSVIKKQVYKKASLPFLVAAVFLVIAVVYLFTDSKTENRLRLIAPRIDPKASASPEAVAERLKRGRTSFDRDTFSEYLKAQNEFIQAVEKGPKVAEAWANLCVTYYELWPYVNQDSSDLKTVKFAAQMASRDQTVTPHSVTCRLIDLLVRGRYSEAQSLVDTILDTHGNSPEPPVFFYYFKAKLLEMSKDYSTALGYVSSAQNLRREWLGPYSLESDILIKLNRPGDAAKRLQQILKVNPAHKVARIRLGLLEHRAFNHPDRARQLLSAAIDDGEDAPRSILSDGYLGLAEIALKLNDQSEALKYAQLSYSQNPSNATSKNLIVKLGGVEKLKKTKVKGQQLVYEGDQYVREGDCNAAQAHYIAAYEMNKKNAIAALKAAKCLWELSFPTQAIEWLNLAIRADPKLIEAYVILADYYTQRYNFFAAAQTLAKAQALAPKSYDVFRGYALVELRRRNPEGAVTWAKKALTAYEADVETYIILAQAYLDLRNYPEAYSAAAKAIEVDVNHRQAQTVYAKALAGIKGVEAGLSYMLELINRYPLAMEYRVGLGQIMMNDERYGDAEKVFRHIIEIDEKPKSGWLELGRALRYQGKLEPARDAFLKAAILDPSDAEPLFEAGLLYLEVKKPAEAKVQFQRVINVNSSYPLVNYYMGKAALMASSHQEALDWAEKERKINPNLADSYLLSADVYTEMKQYRLCAREYQKAIQLRPQGTAIFVKLARCYRLSGSLDVAISMLNQAASKDPGYPEIYKEQGLVYEMKGDYARAVEAYDQFFALDPNSPDIPQIRERILTLQRNSGL